MLVVCSKFEDTKHTKQNTYNKRGIKMPNKDSKNNRSLNNGKVALEFAAGDLERVFKEIVKEHYDFEIIGQGIIAFPKDVAEIFKKQNPIKCKEVEVVSLYHLPRKEANQIRKRLQTVNSISHS